MSQPPSVIHFNCASCNYELAVPVELAGVTGPCPNCTSSITSPTLEQHLQATAVSAATVPAKEAPYLKPKPQATSDATSSSLPPPRKALSEPVLNETKSALPPLRAALPTKPETEINAPREELLGPVDPTNSGSADTLKASVSQESPSERARPQWDDASSSRPKSYGRTQDVSSRPRSWVNVVVFIIASLVVLVCLGIFYSDALRVKFYEYMATRQQETSVPVTEDKALAPKSEVLENAEGLNVDASQEVKLKVEAPPLVELNPAQVPQIPDESSSTSIPQDGLMSKPVLPEGSEAPKALSEATLPDAKMPTADPQEAVADGNGASTQAQEMAPKDEEISIKRALSVEEGTIAESDIVVSAKPEVQEAVEAIKRFCAAPTWEERAKYVQHEAGVRPMMQRFYEVNTYTPVSLGYIDLLYHEPKEKDHELPHAVFQISGAGLSKPVPVMAELGAEGWKIDWLAFTEFSEDLLERFMSDYVESPTRFRVMIRRKTYFGDAKLKKFDSFEVTPPMPGFEAYVFCEKESEIAKVLDREVPWNRPPFAVTVELRWRQEGETKWVEVDSIPQLNWKNPGTTVRKAVPVQ